MFTPAITASRVSAPVLIISNALAQAASPLALEMETGFLPPPLWLGEAETPLAAKAAVPAIQARRFIIICWFTTIPQRSRRESLQYEFTMIERVSPARAIHGTVQVPGDKSISHRYAMLTSLASGRSTIY